MFNKIALIFISLIPLCSNSQAASLKLSDCALTTEQQSNSIQEHLKYGPLDSSKLYPRRGYVMAYNTEQKVPAWVAYHIISEYRDLPDRKKSQWGKFRTDPELPEITNKHYNYWHGSEFNFARGHLAPYYISGGDRDDDGMDADIEGTGKVEDPDDACTTMEINAMTNITPQYHSAFNGSGGLWYELETNIRNAVDEGSEFYIYAGSIFESGQPIQKIGLRSKEDGSPLADWNIGVPHGFFKIVINAETNEKSTYVFNHSGDVGGCNLDDTLEKCKLPDSIVNSLINLNPN